MASRLYEYFKMRWQSCSITQEQLQTAVQKGYITPAEYDEIVTLPQNCTLLTAKGESF